MKKICVILFIGIFLALGMLPGCKKKLPTEPDIPEITLPTIQSFTANPTSVMLQQYSLLTWYTEDATSARIDPDVGTVDVNASVKVYPSESTTYTLTVSNSAGSATRYCSVEIKKCAVLEYSTIPADIYFSSTEFATLATFTIVLKETNGVGGHFSDIRVESASPECYSVGWGAGSFNPYGYFDVLVSLVIPCKPLYVIVSWKWTDDSGCEDASNIWYLLWWNQNTATAQIIKKGGD